MNCQYLLSKILKASLVQNGKVTRIPRQRNKSKQQQAIQFIHMAMWDTKNQKSSIKVGLNIYSTNTVKIFKIRCRAIKKEHLYTYHKISQNYKHIHMHKHTCTGVHNKSGEIQPRPVSELTVLYKVTFLDFTVDCGSISSIFPNTIIGAN